MSRPFGRRPQVLDTERLAEELRRLHQAAGAPSYRSLTLQAKAERVKFGVATLSDWFCGNTVPSDPAVFRYLVETLEARAARRARILPAGAVPAYRRRDAAQWEALRRLAVGSRQEMIATAGNPPLPPSAGTDAADDGKAAMPEVEPDLKPVLEPELEPERKRAGAGLVRRLLTPAWAAAAGGLAAGVGIGLALGGLTAPDGSVARASARPAAPAPQPPAPTFVLAGRSTSAEPLPGPHHWYVAHGVAEPDACPEGWVCLFQNPEFNSAAPGWMIIARDEDEVYDLPGQYDHAVRSWINTTNVDVAWHADPDDAGDFHGMDPHTRRGDLGGEDRTMASLHILTDDRAFPPGSKP